MYEFESIFLNHPLFQKLQFSSKRNLSLVHFNFYTFPFLIFLAVALRPNAGHGLLFLEVSRSHATTHHRRQDSSGRVISSSQRPLPDNTQHSQQTNVHAPGGIRTHDLSRRGAANLRLRQRGHWDRRPLIIPLTFSQLHDKRWGLRVTSSLSEVHK